MSGNHLKFSLKTLLVFVTLACVLLAWGAAVIRHRIRLEQHRTAFLELDDHVSELDSKLRLHVLSLTEIASQLRRQNPVDPAMALGESVMSESLAFGTFKFSRSYHYHWQLDDGSRGEGVSLLVQSVISEDSFNDHVVRVSYQPNELNDEVASWMGDQIQQMGDVEVQYVKLPQPPAHGFGSSSSNDGGDSDDSGEIAAPSSYGGLR